MTNVVAYCRVSTDKSDQLNSLATQKEFFEAYCKKNDFNLVRTYADEGITGTKLKNRKEFLRLMKDSKIGIFDIVLVKDISRFARNTVDFLQSIRTLKSLDIETMFLSSNMTVLGNSEFVITLLAALAQEESSNTSKRIKFGKKLNAEKGRVPNFVYGYDKINGDYFSLLINPQEAKVVKRIFDMYTQDGHGNRKIAAILNEEGLRTKRGSQWSQPAINRILKNEIYTGVVVNGKEEVKDFLTGVRTKTDEEDWLIKEVPELKIIDIEQYNLAKKILQDRYDDFHIGKNRYNNKYPFSGLIKCGECSKTFRRFEYKYQKRFVKWACTLRNQEGVNACCNDVRIDDAELKRTLNEYFVSILKEKNDVIESIKKEFMAIYKTNDDTESQRIELTKELSKLNKTREKNMDMYTDDLITRDELKNRQKAVNSRIEKLESDLSLLNYNLNKGDILESLLKKNFETIENISSVESMTGAQLKEIIKKIVVNKDGTIHIYLNLLSEIGLDETCLIGNNCTFSCNKIDMLFIEVA